MKPAHTNFRSVLALVLLGAVAACCFSLGMWQLSRAAERDALHNAIERGRLQAPLVLSGDSRPAELTAWRAATARGVWAPQHTVLLENRNLDGRPGYWVATPLMLDDATRRTSTGTAILVLRGWLPRDLNAAGGTPSIPMERGLVEVTGEMHTHVPRIFELWQWAGGKSSSLPSKFPADGPPVVQNLELREYARATGLNVLPVVLAQTQESVALQHGAAGDATSGSHSGTASGPPGNVTSSTAPLAREWPGPSLDSDQNRGYALQWFSFSAIAAIAAALIARGMLRKAPRGGRNKETS